MRGNNVAIGNNVTIYPQVSIGEGCRILDGVVLGRLPLSTGNVIRPLPDEHLPLHVGAGSVIGCNSILYTGVTLGEKVLICDSSNIREGSVLEDHVFLARCVMVNSNNHIGSRTRVMDSTYLAGNMVVEEDVFIGMGVISSNDPNVYLSRFGFGKHHFQGPTIR